MPSFADLPLAAPGIFRTSDTGGGPSHWAAPVDEFSLGPTAFERIIHRVRTPCREAGMKQS